MKVKCKYCHDYTDIDEAYRVGLSSYCSSEHFYAQQHQSQKDAIARRRRTSTEMSAQDKAVARLADGNKCRCCNSRNNLQVHHIKYRSEGGTNDKENLITVCVECHGLVHSNKKQYQPLLFELVELRSIGDIETSLRELQENNER